MKEIARYRRPSLSTCIAVLFAVLLSLFTASCGKQAEETIVLAAPFGPLAYPFVSMAKQEGPHHYELKIWKNPDQLRAMIAGNQADFFALPTNVAAVLSNKGADVSLLNVSIWSVLWIVSTDSTKHALADFRGEELIMPFRGDMPHIIFTTIAREQGIDPENDFNLRYVGTPQDAVQQLLLGRANHAVLCEPDLSILMFRAKEQAEKTGEAVRFHRVVDLQDEWDMVFHSGRAIPIGGVAITGKIAGNRDLLDMFSGDYNKAVEWCVNHPAETGTLVASYFEGVPAEPVAEAVRHVDQHVESAKDARDRLGKFFDVLLKANPASVGGALPGDTFYRE